ncbi:hypothetical protein [Variovorax sp. RCC_210]|uniref:hypothetical protein n=1 Tax=Variovorax sp. RCC_210 TaxID=3239217 RepID=UPI003524EB1E
MDRLQRDAQQAFDQSPTIRGFARNGFPVLNVVSTPEALEIYAFSPGGTRPRSKPTGCAFDHTQGNEARSKK